MAHSRGLRGPQAEWRCRNAPQLTALDVTDLETVRKGLIVTIRRSKTDQDRKVARSAPLMAGHGIAPWQQLMRG